jgi:hypothetical protein
MRHPDYLRGTWEVSTSLPASHIYVRYHVGKGMVVLGWPCGFEVLNESDAMDMSEFKMLMPAPCAA